MAKAPAKKAPAKKVPAKKAAVKKAPSGTLTERMGEVKNRPNKGLPARIQKVKGNLNKANPPKEIRLGGQGGTGRSLTRGQPPAKFKPVPLGDRPKLLSGPANRAASGIGGTIARGAFRAVGGPAAMLVSMTTEAGRGSDKPSGKLFSPSQNRDAGKGNPKTVNPYKSSASAKAKVPSRGEARGGMKSTLAAYRAEKVGKSSVSMAGGGVNRPEAKASTFREKNLKANQNMGRKVAASAPKPQARPSMPKPKSESFAQASLRGRSEEYTRNKMRPKGNLLGLLRSKRK